MSATPARQTTTPTLATKLTGEGNILITKTDRPLLIHCSYHKCLTVYFGRVMKGLLHYCLPWHGYRHYNSDLATFHRELSSRKLRLRSINNHFLAADSLPEGRISRFIRDPRDLVVSGYFYHRRGAEAWTRIPHPSEQDWRFANGVVPDGMQDFVGSFAEFLQTVTKEEGLLAELAFRKNHFDSMRLWPKTDSTLVLRYEQVLGNEESSFAKLFEFYGFGNLERRLGTFFAKRYALKRQAGRDAHIRDPTVEQWREHFTPRVHAAFESAHPGLLEQLGYLPN